MIMVQREIVVKANPNPLPASLMDRRKDFLLQECRKKIMTLIPQPITVMVAHIFAAWFQRTRPYG